jgi:hypothetical protein
MRGFGEALVLFKAFRLGAPSLDLVRITGFQHLGAGSTLRHLYMKPNIR